jgi:hypothetical protein
LPTGVGIDDFIAYMPSHSYIYIPTREMWPGASVNARIPPVAADTSATAWLDRHSAAEQMTWAPGEPMLIADRLISNGSWISHPGARCFNLYRPPWQLEGDANGAGKWIAHIDRLYGVESARHIIRYFAFKVQYPHIKINHALLLGGEQGIGKDTICEPLKYAVGPWNFEEISPKVICGRFNGYVKSVLLRVSEARDLGDINRFELYEHMKTLTASPPDTMRVDEKHLREYYVFNVCGVIITTNYKSNGLYLPAEDRRHYVAWSDYRKEDFSEDYWDTIWGWYENEGGYGHVAAYLNQLDLSDFNPKAPPPKTEAFWAIVDANRSPDDAGLADALDLLGRPNVATIDTIARAAEPDTAIWLRDRKSRRQIPYHLENCGYTPVRNGAAKDGQWVINGKRQAVYAKCELSLAARITAAKALTEVP